MKMENNLAKRIVRHLDAGLSALEPTTRDRLSVARKTALAAYNPRPRRRFGMAWAGAGFNGEQPYYRAWVPVAALVFGLLVVDYWQAHYPAANDLLDVDVSLLIEEMPVHAYLDNGFDAWLEGDSQE